MHTEVSKVAATGTFVLLRSKPGKALFVDETSKRRDAGYKNVNSKIEFQALDEVRLVEILLSDIMLVWLDPLKVSSQEDAVALAFEIWLDDESFSPFRSELHFEAGCIIWEDPSLREKVILVGH